MTTVDKKHVSDFSIAYKKTFSEKSTVDGDLESVTKSVTNVSIPKKKHLIKRFSPQCNKKVNSVFL